MRVLSIMLVFLFLFSGCSNGDSAMEQALSIRSRLEKSGCEFSTVITADYQDHIYEFKLHCSVDALGDVSFTVMEPESISGITGNLSNDGGKLTFDDQALMFSVLSEGLLSPVSAPWIFIKALKGGYISGTGESNTGILIQIDDTYADNTLKLDVRTDSSYIPSSAEIYWQGRRIITMIVENFSFL